MPLHPRNCDCPLCRQGGEEEVGMVHFLRVCLDIVLFTLATAVVVGFVFAQFATR
jgi:hypothetical protein